LKKSKIEFKLYKKKLIKEKSKLKYIILGEKQLKKNINNFIEKNSLSYDDVILVPQYSDIKSRTEIDLSISLTNNLHLQLPIISSPMNTVTETNMANAINQLGGLGILHRYNSIEYQCKLLSFVENENLRAAAIGISGDYKERLQALITHGLKIVCLDVAHGDHIMMIECIEWIKKEYPSLYIIAGNVATAEGFVRLSSAGADAVRVSIGSGSICTTRIQTGHGRPTLEAIFEINEIKKSLGLKTLIIADGGIKNAGDIIKSLAAGANLVMLGSLLSGTYESPGRIVKNEKGSFKRYAGMASKEAQLKGRGKYNSIEGIATFVKFKGNVKYTINELQTNMKSGFSYSGARNQHELQENAIFQLQTLSSHFEGLPHILKV